METKRCNGPFHPPGGEMVPLSQYTVNKSGPRQGKPLSRCKTCRSLTNSKTIPYTVFMPLLETLLVGRDVLEVSNLVNLNPEHIRELSAGRRKRIYKKTFLNLSRAASSLPKEKISIGPTNKKSKRNGINKLTYEERLGLKQLVSAAQKERYKKEKQLLKHVV